MMHRIGRYEVQSELGHGGFGQVFRAFDPTVGRMVAIKTLTAGGEPELLTRFRNEAAAAGKLRHKNIVTIYDFGEHNGSPYIVMELLDGQDLEHMIDRSVPLTLLQKLDIMVQVAAGLDHAHKNGVVHRDVKPANAMLLPDGLVKILDFGIALVTQTSAARITPKGSLLGTFPYMAPEQFYGSASDALCDIFAYGVTSYKLLTGKHPFHALEMAKLMHNIMNMTPEPLRGCTPDCPEALENAMIKLLAKDREARYQSLEDLQFDLEPVILDLRRESVRDLVSGARNLIESGQLEDAQSKIRQALDIEPGNPTARELRENLQRLIREKTLRPRIEALVSEGRVRLDERSFQQAIEKFESALRLDKSNPKIHVLLEEARAAWLKAQRAEQHLEQAGLAMNRGDLTLARESLSEALAADPKNEKAADLLSDLQTRIESRQRERHLRDELSRIRGLMLLQSYEEASEALGRIASQYPASEEVAALWERVRGGKAELARRKRLESSTAEAKELLRKRQYEEAVKHLAQCRAEFPDSAELRDLAAYAEEQLSEQKQAQAVAQIGSEARALADRGEFEAAIQKLRSALDRYPGAAALRELMQNIAAAKAARQRQAALDDAVEKTTALCNDSRFAEALERINAFVRAYGDTAALAALRKQAEEGFERQGRSAAIRRLIVEAQGLINAGRPATATEVLLRATHEFPGDPEVTALLDLAQHRLRGQQREEAISNLIREAEGLARAGEFDRALALLDDGLREYSDSERLLRCRNATQASRSAHEREIADRQREKRRHEIMAVVEKAKERLALGRPQEAVQLLQPAATQYPDEEQLIQLLSTAVERIREQQTALEREHFIVETLSKISELYQNGRLEEALREIQVSEQKWGHDPRLSELKNRLESEWMIVQREAELQASRQRDLERLLSIESLIAPGTPKRELRRLLAEVSAVAIAHPSDAEILQIASRARKRIETALAAQRKPIPWIPIGVGTAVAVLGLAILLVVPKLFVKQAAPAQVAPAQLVPIEIRTDPPGASVRLGERSCVTPHCRFDLPPGQYQAAVQLKDFEPLHETLTVDAAKPNALVELTLQPLATPSPVPAAPSAATSQKTLLPGTLVIETSVPAVLVVVDGKRRFRTDTRGSFRTEIDAGEHDVHVEKVGYQTPPSQRVKIAQGTSKVASFRLEPENANLILVGAPAGIEFRVGDITKRTDGASTFSMQVKGGTDGLSVAVDGSSKLIAQRFAPGQEVRLEWKNIAPPPSASAPKTTAVTKNPADSETPQKILEAPATSVVIAPTPSPATIPLPPAAGPPPPPVSTTKPQPAADAKSQAEAAIRHGITLTEAYQWKEAIGIFGDAIRLDPSSAAAYYNRAGAHYRLGQFQDAIADYERTLALDPKYPKATEHLKFAQNRWKMRAVIIGDEISPPLPTIMVSPSYPRAARDAGIHGVVDVECVIDDGGEPTACRVVKSPDPRLEKSAIEAVAQWRFKPALRNGQRVAVVVTLPVRFK